MAAPSKNFTSIVDSAIDADSPLDTTLMTQIRDSLVHLEEWLGMSYTAAQDHDHDGVNSKSVVSVADGSVTTSKLYPASFTAGTTQLVLSGTEVTRTTGTSGYIASGKAIQVKKAGTYRIQFSGKTDNDSGTEFARLYKNSTTAIGIERNLTTTYTIYTEDLTLAANDIVQVYWKETYNYTLRAKNFGLYVNEDNATILYAVLG